jgi:hypothetical protein
LLTTKCEQNEELKGVQETHTSTRPDQKTIETESSDIANSLFSTSYCIYVENDYTNQKSTNILKYISSLICG